MNTIKPGLVVGVSDGFSIGVVYDRTRVVVGVSDRFSVGLVYDQTSVSSGG